MSWNRSRRTCRLGIDHVRVELRRHRWGLLSRSEGVALHAVSAAAVTWILLRTHRAHLEIPTKMGFEH